MTLLLFDEIEGVADAAAKVATFLRIHPKQIDGETETTTTIESEMSWACFTSRVLDRCGSALSFFFLTQKFSC